MTDPLPEATRRVLDFWFVEHGPDDWFGADPAFDRKIEQKFVEDHANLAKGEGVLWRTSAEGRLAEIIVLDQFSRQLFRGQAKAFATDGMALILAQEAVAAGALDQLEPEQKAFLLMPYMHAESLLIQELGIPLFASLGNEQTLAFAKSHHDTIARFGRFPMRNKALGRPSTPEEQAYIAENNGRMF